MDRKSNYLLDKKPKAPHLYIRGKPTLTSLEDTPVTDSASRLPAYTTWLHRDMSRSQEGRSCSVVLDVARREIGGIGPRNFALRQAYAEVFSTISPVLFSASEFWLFG